MGFFINNDKKTYIGRYKGVCCWQYGSMIGSNWYGDYYCTRRKNGRNYKVKDSVCSNIDDLRAYINKHIDELKEV